MTPAQAVPFAMLLITLMTLAVQYGRLIQRADHNDLLLKQIAVEREREAREREAQAEAARARDHELALLLAAEVHARQLLEQLVHHERGSAPPSAPSPMRARTPVPGSVYGPPRR